MSQIRFLACRGYRGRRGLWFGMILWGMGVAFAQTDAGRFRVPDVDENGVLVSMLTGESARMFPDKPMEIGGLVVEFYEADGKTVKIRIVSPFCHYDTRANVAVSDAPIKIDGSGFEVQGEGYRFEAGSSRMEIHSKVKVIFRNIEFKGPKAKSDAQL